MTTVERELLERISRMDSEKQRKVLDYVRSIEEPVQTRSYTARELMRLPPEERNLLVIQALERSADGDVELLDVYDEEGMDDGRPMYWLCPAR